ncbi:transposase, partial [Desulfobacterales bacterium HSG17]|nr:transposase [Desulfobacterales bacterium HSG17]
MDTLHNLLDKLKKEFPTTKKGDERSKWFGYTLLAIIIPFTSAKTSNLLRCLKVLFGFSFLESKRYYRFMASPKIPWDRLWPCLWKAIPKPLSDGRLILAIDDFINPKTGRKIFGCANIFDHAAKLNQSKYPWAQNIVTVGLLKMIKGRWACLPLGYRFYHLKKNIDEINQGLGRRQIKFETKLKQAAAMIISIADNFQSEILAVTDSWFGNNSLWSPIHQQLGSRFHILSRLRSNINIFDLLSPGTVKKIGRPKKYGKKLGNTSDLAIRFQSLATTYEVNLYGR